MMRLRVAALGLSAVLTGVIPVQGFELTPTELWNQKLAQLCAAAMYGSRMVAEPICQELEQVIRKSVAGETAPVPQPAAPGKKK